MTKAKSGRKGRPPKGGQAFRALENSEVMKSKFAADRIGLQVISERLRELGYGIRLAPGKTQGHGMNPELAGISRERIMLYSGGLASIHRWLEAKGVNPALATRAQGALANYVERLGKDGADPEQLHARWQELGLAAGFDTLSPELLRQAPGQELQVPLSAQDQVSQSIARLLEKSQVIDSSHDIVAAAIEASQFQISGTRINQAIEDMKASGQIIELEQDGRLATPETARFLGLLPAPWDAPANPELLQAIGNGQVPAELSQRPMSSQALQGHVFNGDAILITDSEASRAEANMASHEALVAHDKAPVATVQAWERSGTEEQVLAPLDLFRVSNTIAGIRTPTRAHEKAKDLRRGEWVSLFGLDPSSGKVTVAMRRNGELVNLELGKHLASLEACKSVDLEIARGDILRTTTTMPSVAIREGERIRVRELRPDGTIVAVTLDASERLVELDPSKGPVPVDYGYAWSPEVAPVGPSARVEHAVVQGSPDVDLGPALRLAGTCGKSVETRVSDFAYDISRVKTQDQGPVLQIVR